MILCPNCRAPNPDSFRFCGRCGKPLREEKVEEPPQGEAIPSWLRELGQGLEVGPGPAIRREAGVPEEAPLPPWLAEEAPAPAPEEAPLPPWLAEAPAEEVPAAAVAEEAAAAEVPAGLMAEEELELPPWLTETPEEEKEEALPLWTEVAPAEAAVEARPAEAPEEALPPWMEEVAPAEAPVEARPAEAPEEALPPWMEEVAPAEAAVEARPAEAPEEVLPPWMEEMAPAEAVPEEELYAPAPVTPEEEAALPEWARALKPKEEERAPMPFLEGVELPEWLRAEERPAEEKAVEAPATELAWLERLAGEEAEEEAPTPAAIERLPRPPLPPLSPARREAAELFAALVAVPEPEKRPRARRLPSFSQRLLHWLSQRWPMLALALLMAVMVAANISLPGARVPVPEAEQAFTSVEQAIAWSSEAGETPRPVLVAFDWDLHRVGEMRPLALVVLRHLLKWKAPVIAVSTTFQGSQLAQETMETALLEVLPRGNDYGEPGTGQVFQTVDRLARQYGEFRDYAYGDYFLNLGIRTGAESALRLLADQPLSWTFPRDFLYGRPSADYPLLQRVPSLEDVSLLVVMVGEEDRALGWLEQVIARYPNKPCLLVIPTELGPLVQPYRQARAGTPALLRGVAAAVQYEALLRDREQVSLSPGLSVERRLSLLTVAQFGLVALILLGNLALLGGWRPHSRREANRT